MGCTWRSLAQRNRNAYHTQLSAGPCFPKLSTRPPVARQQLAVPVIVLSGDQRVVLVLQGGRLPERFPGQGTLSRHPPIWGAIGLTLPLFLEGDFQCCRARPVIQEVLACSRSPSQRSRSLQVPLSRWARAGLMAQGLLQSRSQGCPHAGGRCL